MAKKISLDEYKKKQSSSVEINDYDASEENLIVNERESKKGWKKIVFIISCVVNVILLFILVLSFVKFDDEKEAYKDEISILEDEIEGLKYDSTTLYNLLDGNSSWYVENKLDFLDEHIRFKIEGFGNYYYTYDCMMEKVDGEFSFWVYTINGARNSGLQKGSC